MLCHSCCTPAYLTRYSSRRSSAFRSHTPCEGQQDEERVTPPTTQGLYQTHGSLRRLEVTHAMQSAEQVHPCGYPR